MGHQGVYHLLPVLDKLPGKRSASWGLNWAMLAQGLLHRAIAQKGILPVGGVGAKDNGGAAVEIRGRGRTALAASSSTTGLRLNKLRGQ